MISNYKSLIAIAVVFNVAYLTYDLSIPSSNGGNQPLTRTDLNLYDEKEYIIDTPGCRIENVDPYSEEIKDYIYKVNAITCSSRKPLTYILKREDKLTLNINASLLTDYSMLPVTCCFSTIKRNPLGPHPDDNLIISDCAQFNDSVRVTGDLVKVECSNFFHKVYENVHITLQPPNATVLNKDAPNVLLIGIDGVSRSNLIRTMPRTMEFCEKNGWVNLKGYNKIADNTFPNLMAVLTGMNDSESERVCNPYDQSKLNGCEYFIWKRYKRHGYSTAYAEDTPRMATFNGIKVGFKDPPTDYYFRPYFLASNLLSSKRLCLNAHCTGPEKTGMRMQNAIRDFLSAVNNRTRGFGLFWMNSFSHEDFNCPSSMDDDFVSFFEGLRNEGHLDNTVILFFSDHGFRYGKIRLTHTGWMEERLPFIYLWIPNNFRTAHQEEYKNLLENSEKLTTPFDLHMTLQHILSLSNATFVESPSQGCPECRSLFRPIPSNRSCSQSGVPQHYCTCSMYEKLDRNTPLVRKVANFFVDKLNEIVGSYGAESSGCSTYFLRKVAHAKSLVISDTEENVLVGIVTNPDANFEGTVKVLYDGGNSSFVLMETNRLDRYAPKTFCVKKSTVQKYCYCKSLLKRIANIFCNNKFCFLYA